MTTGSLNWDPFGRDQSQGSNVAVGIFRGIFPEKNRALYEVWVGVMFHDLNVMWLLVQT